MSSRRKGNNQYGGIVGKIKPAQSPEEIARAAAYGNNGSPSQAELNAIAKYKARQAAAAANPVVDPKKYRKVWENWSGGRSGRSRKSRRTHRRKRTRRHR